MRGARLAQPWPLALITPHRNREQREASSWNKNNNNVNRRHAQI